MKISIWQQFASNHSNNFTIIGKFKTEDEAKKVAKRLEDMLEAIYLQSIAYDDEEPVQAELDLAKEFGIEWTRHLDWIEIDEYRHVLQFDHYVEISDRHEGTQGKLYIDQIMSKLASHTYIEGEHEITAIAVLLSCLAPSIELANAIYTELDAYFIEVRAEKGHLIETPWEQFEQGINNYLGNADAYYGYIHQTGKKLSFDHLTFGAIGHGLHSLIAYLKDKGCTKFKYTINEVDMDELYEEGKHD